MSILLFIASFVCHVVDMARQPSFSPWEHIAQGGCKSETINGITFNSCPFVKKGAFWAIACSKTIINKDTIFIISPISKKDFRDPIFLIDYRSANSPYYCKVKFGYMKFVDLECLENSHSNYFSHSEVESFHNNFNGRQLMVPVNLKFYFDYSEFQKDGRFIAAKGYFKDVRRGKTLGSPFLVSKVNHLFLCDSISKK